jgi:hypothetical protein
MKRAFAPILLLLLLTACADSDLNKVSKALVDVAATNGELQTTVINAYDLKLLSERNTRTILELQQKVNLAGKEAIQLTREINKLDSVSRAKILVILQPVLAAVNNSLNTGLLGIDHKATADKIRVLLLSIQSYLNTVQLVIAGGA